MRQAAGVAGGDEQCTAVWLVTRGWRGVGPSVAVFQSSSSLGTCVRDECYNVRYV